ncbi:MAG: GGDEF domain-containing protein [Lachnospiraceae bacterium]|nr:GGDEF domain-containing protein [Lachnospiraceae bacterium]
MNEFKKYLISVDKNMNVINMGDDFLELLGRKALRNLDQVIPPQDMMQLQNVVFSIDPGNLALSCFRIRTATGKLNWIAANVEKLADNEEVIHMELSDIQTLKAEGVLAHYDEMTGILNKQAIKDYAEKLTQEYPRKCFYFCLMDIDHFKSVNDTFGHMCGDEVIIDVAHIIRDCVGSNGVVGRIGGDEFMIVLDHVQDKPKAREVLASIRETVEAKYHQFKDSLDITVSIGSSFYPEYSSDYDEMFQLTDKMLYRAKTKGRNRYIIYTPEVHGKVSDLLGGDEKVATVTYQIASGSDKMGLMLDLMAGFLHKTDISIQMAMERVLHAYELDEMYLFYGTLERREYGITRVNVDGGTYKVEDCEKAMFILGEEEFAELFNKNNLAMANIFDLNKDQYGDVIRYMEENNYRFMLVYRMSDARKDGYLVCVSRTESPCRLSESDIAELVYFGRMLELTSLDR